jgi:hypothetical protein
MKSMRYIFSGSARPGMMAHRIPAAVISIVAAGAALILAAAAAAEPLPSPSASPSLVSGPTPPPPRIEFTETSFNAGSAWEGDVVSHLFSFRNAGAGTLHVSRVRSTCGCTAALSSRDTLEPGETGEIKVEFNTRRYHGNQKKTVFVTSDDPANATVQLHLEVEVKTAGSLSPRSLTFHHMSFGEQTTRTVQVVPEDLPFRVTGVRAEPAVFGARILGERNEASKEKGPVDIEVAFGPLTAVGGQNGSLIVNTDHPRLPELRATLAASVDGNLQFSPRMILFTRDDLNAGTVKKIVFSHRSESDFSVLSVRSEAAQFQAEAATEEAAEEAVVEVRLAPDTPPGRYRSVIVVGTNQPGQEEIKIPVTANIQK